MADIYLRSSKIDDSWHAEKDGSIIASGEHKAVLLDARLALGPGEHIVRGSAIAMRHPPTPAAVKKAHAAATPTRAPKAKAPKAKAPKKKRARARRADATKTPSRSTGDETGGPSER